ncbi:hypothetical protein BXZ70DRAFT_121524 [Cristinia sonorae]|uniref:Uncharacterized protein n=1 Tax=Cristinia sonorae TaxID=1940300 RepID=A0A8K0UQY5_9AGAR|nr:hypothetical protein BXZ70DRAFT_121524 [Cristinia sonorae]
MDTAVSSGEPKMGSESVVSGSSFVDSLSANDGMVAVVPPATSSASLALSFTSTLFASPFSGVASAPFSLASSASNDASYSNSTSRTLASRMIASASGVTENASRTGSTATKSSGLMYFLNFLPSQLNCMSSFRTANLAESTGSWTGCSDVGVGVKGALTLLKILDRRDDFLAAVFLMRGRDSGVHGVLRVTMFAGVVSSSRAVSAAGSGICCCVSSSCATTGLGLSSLSETVSSGAVDCGSSNDSPSLARMSLLVLAASGAGSTLVAPDVSGRAAAGSATRVEDWPTGRDAGSVVSGTAGAASGAECSSATSATLASSSTWTLQTILGSPHSEQCVVRPFQTGILEGLTTASLTSTSATSSISISTSTPVFSCATCTTSAILRGILWDGAANSKTDSLHSGERIGEGRGSVNRVRLKARLGATCWLRVIFERASGKQRTVRDGVQPDGR